MHYMNETYELAMKLCGFDPDNDDQFDEAEDKIEEILWDKYEITEESFERLVKDLLPHGHLDQSELSGKLRTGFCDHDRGVYLIQKEFEPKATA